MITDDQKELRELVQEICDAESGLTNWEITFIDDMCNWEGDYTEKQSDKIRSIHERVVG